MKKIRFPPELYRFIPALYPHLAEILESVGLTGTEFFALSYIRHQGKLIEEGRVALPISSLKVMLMKTGAYASESGAHGFISGHLETTKHYVEHQRLTPQQKKELFPKATGHRDVVVLAQLGEEKLDGVNARVEKLFEETIRGVSPILLRGVLQAIVTLATPVILRLELLASHDGNIDEVKDRK